MDVIHLQLNCKKNTPPIIDTFTTHVCEQKTPGTKRPRESDTFMTVLMTVLTTQDTTPDPQASSITSSSSFTNTSPSFHRKTIPPSECVPELMAPAGNWDCARAAVANGADAIYFGLQSFNARMRANNFTLEELPDLMRYLHAHGVRGFVTMNTLIFPNELADAERQILALQAAQVDAVIVQDLGLAWLIREVAPDLELHASTQMTITSPEGLHFLDGILQLDRVVLARELSVREIEKFEPEQLPVPIEVFVHGALCVAYSGQCLTSESLGQRSANRGECAQACRMPYELVVDGKTVELGEQRYLLSPQDLAAVELIDDLVQKGVKTFKIEGRLKSPEYVALVTRVYRKALDAALAGKSSRDVVTQQDRYALEMAFSRGLSTGWLEGTDHPKLTHGRFAKKRGVFLGTIVNVGPGWVQLQRADVSIPLQPEDGVVFDAGEDRNHEQGGRIWRIEQDRLFFHRRSQLQWKRIRKGQTLWKTDDPALNEQIKQSWQSFPQDIPKQEIHIQVKGCVGQPLSLSCGEITVESNLCLEPAQQHPLTEEVLRQQLGRLGNTPYTLGSIDMQIEGSLLLPLSTLNQLRRALVHQLETAASTQRVNIPQTPHYQTLLPQPMQANSLDSQPIQQAKKPELRVLCRSLGQIEVALSCEVAAIYVDFEDVRRFRDAVDLVRRYTQAPPVFLATPRIQKAGEGGHFRWIDKVQPDGVLIRNLGALHFFQNRQDLQLVGDFSLNVANPLTARLLLEHSSLQHLTLSSDLNLEQVLDVLSQTPVSWFELILHQHMPMFHMEHCVYCAFLSNGKDYRDCGRPCDNHKVHLRDRVGQLHLLQADVGCRNTLFNGRAQTGARFYPKLSATGLFRYRVELLDESPERAEQCIVAYQRLLSGDVQPQPLWQRLGALERLGVTEGTLAPSVLTESR